MTPEFEAAVRLAEQDHFNDLASELARVKSDTRNLHAATGTLRSGGYLQNLLEGQLAALASHASVVADSYVRLASRTGLLSRADAEEWLTSRLERSLSAKGLLASLSEEAKVIRVPHDTFDAEAQRQIGALRSRAKVRLRRLISEARLTAPVPQPPPPPEGAPSVRELIEDRISKLDDLEAELGKTPYAFGRYIEPLNRWRRTSARLFAERGLATIGSRLGRVGYMGTGDPLLDEPHIIAANRQFLADLLKQADRDPAVLEPDVGDGSGSMAKDPRRVAVVHGRDTAAKDGVFALLWALGLSPVEWEQAVRETGKGSPYNRQVVEQLFVATQAVLIVLTGDEDVVLREPFRHKVEDGRQRRQARGNVFFEAGMAFILHPDRTILVEIGEQELPSDLDGLNAVRFDGSAEARHKLKGRLETAGCQVQASGTGWLSAGAEHFQKATQL